MPHHNSTRTITGEELNNLLAAALPGAIIRVRDDTHKHLEHNAMVGHFGGHFVVNITWGGFAAMPRLARHRHIMALVDAPWRDVRIHSITLRLLAPDEAEVMA